MPGVALQEANPNRLEAPFVPVIQPAREDEVDRLPATATRL